VCSSDLGLPVVPLVQIEIAVLSDVAFAGLFPSGAASASNYVAKVLAAVMTVVVLVVGAVVYKNQTGCCPIAAIHDAVSSQPDSTPTPPGSPPCFVAPARTSCCTLSAETPACCEDVDFNVAPKPEVLTIQPREVN